MKTIVSLCTIALAALSMNFAANAQTVTIPYGETVEQTIKLKSSDYTVGATNVKAFFSYDMDEQELTLRMVLERGENDHLWMPLRSYDDDMLNQEVKQTLRGKMSMARPFKHKMVFGVQSTFECANCDLVKTEKPGIAKELFSRKDTATYRFHVKDPHSPVSITLRSCTPVQTLERPSGKMQYTFQYIADKVTLNIEVPIDPCRDEQIIALTDAASNLKDYVDATSTELAQAVKYKKREECLEKKQMIEEDYRSQYDSLQAWYNNMTLSCLMTDELMHAIDSTIAVATEQQCPQKAAASKHETMVVTPPEDYTPPKPANKIASDIKLYAETLDKCVTNIRNDKNANEEKQKGNNIMKRAKSYIDKLSDKQKEDPQIIRAIKMFEYAEKTFKMIL